jgi:tetratricopeptide (TPR) repeat protein
MQRAIDRFRALGIHTVAGSCYHDLAPLELAAGDPQAALVGLLESDAELAELGEGGFRSTTQALLAQVYELLGDRAAACTAMELAEKLGGPEDTLNYAITDAVRARIALADGDLDAAERWARSAVDHAYRMDNPAWHGNAELKLARVLAALGRRTEARTEARLALDLYQAKGHRPGAAEAQALLDELGPDA